MFSITAVALALAALQAPFNALAQSSDCARSYVVSSGDTCDKISAANNVSTFQLAFVNPQIDSDCSNLGPDEPLCLGIVGQDCNVTHVVASGDSCSSIDTAAGIPLSTLLANNQNVNSDCSNIYLGEVLCVSSTVFNYTTKAD